MGTLRYISVALVLFIILVGVVYFTMFERDNLSSSNDPVVTSSEADDLYASPWKNDSPNIVEEGDSGSSESSSVSFAPELSTTTLSGDEFNLASLRGEKPVIVEFWASWCPNCQRNMPALSSLYEEYDGQFEVVGVNIQESASTAQKFVDKHSIAYPIVLDPDSEIATSYNAQYTNYHVLISRRGEVVSIKPSDITREDIDHLLEL